MEYKHEPVRAIVAEEVAIAIGTSEERENERERECEFARKRRLQNYLSGTQNWASERR